MKKVLWHTVRLVALAAAAFAFWIRFIATPDQIRTSLFGLVGWLGRIVHGYRAANLEKIPKVGPAMVVCYHGFIPSDMYLLPCEIFNRSPTTPPCFP